MKREAFQAKRTAGAIAWRQRKPELVAAVTIEIHDRVSDHKNPTMNRRRGEDQVLIFFFKHQAKTTNWNPEKKKYYNRETRMRMNLRNFVLLLFLVYLLPLSQCSWMLYSLLKSVKSNKIKKSREIVKHSRILR